MKLIENYAERFHNYTIPSPEKCFELENGDELYIKRWITNGKINGKLKDIFEWIEKKYLSNQSELEKTDKKKFDEIQKRFYIKNWRMILLISIFIFYFAEGKRLKLKLWGIYFPLTFLISLAFSFGAFMFMREIKISKEH